MPPVTATGRVAPLLVPSPSSPCPLSPQQKAALNVVMAQLWFVPALTDEKRCPPATAAGVERLLKLESPTPWPQQYAKPATVTPQVRALPAENVAKERCTSKLSLESGGSPVT